MHNGSYCLLVHVARNNLFPTETGCLSLNLHPLPSTSTSSFLIQNHPTNGSAIQKTCQAGASQIRSDPQIANPLYYNDEEYSEILILEKTIATTSSDLLHLLPCIPTFRKQLCFHYRNFLEKHSILTVSLSRTGYSPHYLESCSSP